METVEESLSKTENLIAPQNWSSKITSNVNFSVLNSSLATSDPKDQSDRRILVAHYINHFNRKFSHSLIKVIRKAKQKDPLTLF